MLLVGGGHAHLELVRRTTAFRAARIDLTLIDPGDFHYSGGASAVLGGSTLPERNRIDLADLCRRSGAAFCRARVVGIDLRGRLAHLDRGPVLAFDRVSFDIGSRPGRGGLDWPAGTIAAKPIADLGRLRDRVVADAGAGRGLLVVGGGATGVELAGNLARLLRSLARPGRVSLVGRAPRLLPGLPPRAGRLAAASLERAGVTVRCGDRAAGFEAGRAHLRSGATIAFDHLVMATGLEPAADIAGLPGVAGRGLAVDRTLASRAAPQVFAVGDCAEIEDWNLPRLGVHGVRAAPVLARNLVASLAGAPLEAYRPRRIALQILDLGDGTGLLAYGGLALRGRAMLRWKRRIDRRFLDRYREA